MTNDQKNAETAWNEVKKQLGRQGIEYKTNSSDKGTFFQLKTPDVKVIDRLTEQLVRQLSMAEYSWLSFDEDEGIIHVSSPDYYNDNY